MLKRKCAGSDVFCEKKPAVKKTPKDCANTALKTLSLDRKTSAPIDCLHEDALINIFELLSPQDRLQIERVCKKWKQAVEKSWSNFRWCTVPFENMTNVLCRSGRFVKRLQINVPSTYNNDIYRLHVSKALFCLSLAPKLKHLTMELPTEEYSLVQMVKLKLWDQLESLSLMFYEIPRTDTLNTLLSKCSQLEYLKLEGTKGYKIEHLPSSLKFLVEKSELYQVIEVVIRQNIALEGLRLPFIYPYQRPYNFLAKMDFTKLRYLTIILCKDTLPSFNAIIGELSQLVAFMVKFRVSVYANKVLYRIVENFKKLQCLDIIFQSGVFDEELIVLADLEHLTHFSILCNNKTAVANLLNALIVKKQLQHFYVRNRISVDLVCEALHKCKALNWIACLLQKQSSFAKLYETLDEIYGKGTSPASNSDPRIRHFYFGHESWEDEPQHPWAIFHEFCTEFNWNSRCQNVFPEMFDGW